MLFYSKNTIFDILLLVQFQLVQLKKPSKIQ